MLHYLGNRLFHRIGRRGSFLLLCSVGYIGYGYLILYEYDLLISDDAVFFEMIPRQIRALVWTGTGLVGLISAFLVKIQPWGYVALLFMPFARILGYAWSVVHYFIPGPPLGSLEVLPGIALWVCIFLMIILVSGWDEDVQPDRPRRLESMRWRR